MSPPAGDTSGDTCRKAALPAYLTASPKPPGDLPVCADVQRKTSASKEGRCLHIRPAGDTIRRAFTLERRMATAPRKSVKKVQTRAKAAAKAAKAVKPSLRARAAKAAKALKAAVAKAKGTRAARIAAGAVAASAVMAAGYAAGKARKSRKKRPW